MSKSLSSTLRGTNYDILPITAGGTGLTSVGTVGNVLTSNGTTWSSQAAAPTSLPSQTGNTDKYLTTDGFTASWATISRTVTVLQRDGTTIQVGII